MQREWPVRRVSRRGISETLFAIGLCLVLIMFSAESTLRSQSPVKTVAITPAWVLNTFLLGIDPDDDSPEVWANIWPSVRERPEMVTSLMAIYRDPATPLLARRNALLLLGATGQEEGYRTLAQLYDRSTPGDRYRLNMIIGFGSGPHEPPDYVYARLEDALSRSVEAERKGAAFALGSIRTERAARILLSRQPTERSSSVSLMISRRLSDIRRQPR